MRGVAGIPAVLGIAVLFTMGGAAAQEPTEAPDGDAPVVDDVASQTWRRHSLLPIPAVFYMPETRWGGGVVALHSYRATPDDRPTLTAINLIYTQERQVTAELRTSAYASGGRYSLGLEAGFTRFPDQFFGIGNATRELDEETFTSRGAQLELDLRRRVRPGLYLGVIYRLRDRSIVDVEPGGLLEHGGVPGHAGGLLSGAGVIGAWDTRDVVAAPTTGSYHVVSATRYAGALGGDFDMTRVGVDLRRYVGLREGQVLALRALGRFTSGDVPFDQLPELGGESLLRGTRQGRFRDRHLAVVEGEYRLHVWWRLGLVAFAGVGRVAGRFEDLSVDRLHHSLGSGVRFALDPRERLNVRVDYGYGDDGASGLYITVGEAF